MLGALSLGDTQGCIIGRFHQVFEAMVTDDDLKPPARCTVMPPSPMHLLDNAEEEEEEE